MKRHMCWKILRLTRLLVFQEIVWQLLEKGGASSRSLIINDATSPKKIGSGKTGQYQLFKYYIANFNCKFYQIFNLGSQKIPNTTCSMATVSKPAFESSLMCFK